jgi:hypothetical protein
MFFLKIPIFGQFGQVGQKKVEHGQTQTGTDEHGRSGRNGRDGQKTAKNHLQPDFDEPASTSSGGAQPSRKIRL